MKYDDMFKTYSPKIRGDLLKYLREHDGFQTSNLFFGAKYFFVIKNHGLLVPKVTWTRVDRSPIPDLGYVVNSDYLLESSGTGSVNMSLVGAEKGVYDPGKVLEQKSWSIFRLNTERLTELINARNQPPQ